MSFDRPSEPEKALPSSPPDEVLEAIDLAAEAYERLAASGCQLHFKLDPPTGKVTVEVHDMAGRVLFTIPGSKALDIASGGTLE
jgi:flagellar protein FlaG